MTKSKFIDIGTMKCKVEQDEHGGIMCKVTHNGYQWSALSVEDEYELSILWQTIGRYLGEDYCPVKDMSTEKLTALRNEVDLELAERGVSNG